MKFKRSYIYLAAFLLLTSIVEVEVFGKGDTGSLPCTQTITLGGPNQACNETITCNGANPFAASPGTGMTTFMGQCDQHAASQACGGAMQLCGTLASKPSE